MGDRSPRRVEFVQEILPRLSEITTSVIPTADSETIDFPCTGMNGVVWYVNYQTENIEWVTVVLKANLDTDLLRAQAAAMRAYAKNGISVPALVEREETETNPYLHIMEFVDRPLLSSIPVADRIANGTSLEMGVLLGRGHLKGFDGFGSLDPDKPGIVGRHDTFSAHIQEEVIDRRLLPLIKAEYLNETAMEQAIIARDVLDQDLGNGQKPVLVNVDFSPNNVFFGEPEESLIVFDPKPKISHPLLDLANTLINSISYTENWDEAHEIIEGYESFEGKVDMKVLDAAMYLMIIYKMHSFWKKGKTERSGRLRGILENIEVVNI